jgi:uncharacterized membrane protein
VEMNVGRTERIASVAAGVALLAVAARRRGAFAGSGLRLWSARQIERVARNAGTGLVVRGLVGYCPVNTLMGRDSLTPDTKAALGGPRGVHVLESIVVPTSPAKAYRFWRDLSNLPRFMSHLERVDVADATHSHWVASGPGGLRVAWDAKVINDVENKLIGWKSLDCADVVSAGSVRFRPTPGGTEITVHLQYDPPGGKLGNWIAGAFGQTPAKAIREDLRRLKRELSEAERQKLLPMNASA